MGFRSRSGPVGRAADHRSASSQDAHRFSTSQRARTGPVELSHRGIFILPNRRGFGLGLLLILQFLIAVNYGNSLTFALTFLLVGIATLSAVYAYRNLAGVRVRTGRSEPVFAGENGLFTIHFDNPSRRPRLGLHARLRGAAEGVDFAIHPEASVTVTLPAPSHVRGWLQMSRVSVSTAYPLGLFRAWSPLHLDQRLLVYPRPAPEACAPPAVPAAGEAAPRQAAGDDDFCGFVGYRPGDPLRTIHWRGLAKGQAIQVKQYVAGAGLAVDLDWQQTAGGDTEARLSLLCRWVLAAERTGTPYSLRLPGAAIPTGSGDEHRHRCLKALALFGR